MAYRRERWTLADGDFIDADFAHHPGRTEPDAAKPLVVMLHGLEGSSRSHYAEAAMAVVLKRGWRGVVVHWRGCSGEINLAPRAYHSGETDDIDWAFRRLAKPAVPMFAIGVSLGGNALLKWLGERGSGASALLAGAVAVSAPHDLHAGAIALARGFNLVYTRNFLRTLKRKSLLKLEQYPGLFDRDKLLRARTFHDFDDLVTAPLHGFASCYDYWERCSSQRFVASIRLPTLILNARNDPFLPASALLAPATDVWGLGGLLYTSFKDGKPDGEWTTWHAVATKSSEGRYRMGDREGSWTYWDEAGNVEKVEEWVNGELQR